MEQQKHEMEITQQHEMDEAKMRFFTNVSHDVWVLCADGHFSFPSYIKEYPKKAQTLDGTTKA